MTGHTVYLLQHIHEFDDGHEDVKLIGLYSSKELALHAKERRAAEAGFRDMPDGFKISEHVVDDDHAGWPEGYVTEKSDMDA